MKCYVVKDLMPEYIEKLCNEETAKDIEAHIAGCKKCQETLKEMSADISKDTKDLDIQPFDKIQKKIKREKIKKILLAVCLLLVVSVFGVLSFFQANPNMGGPSFDTIIYWKKAGDVGRYIANGNIDKLMLGVNNSADVLNHVNNDLINSEAAFYEDYSEKLKVLYDEVFAGKKYKVKVRSVGYSDRGYYGLKIYDQEESQAGGYGARVDLISEDSVIPLSILFYSKDAYIIWDSSVAIDDSFDQFYNFYKFYAGPLTGVDGDGTWAWKVIFKPGRELEKASFNLFACNFTTDGMCRTDDEAYQSKIQDATKSIYADSTTLAIQLDQVKYNEEKQCIDGKLFWELLDKNGKHGLLVKDFYIGPYGAAPVDATETVFHDEGFDAEIISNLENMFD